MPVVRYVLYQFKAVHVFAVKGIVNLKSNHLERSYKGFEVLSQSHFHSLAKPLPKLHANSKRKL